MSGPKIMVFQLKEIIKIAIIVLAAVILICILAFFLMPKKNTGASYTPGTYCAQIILHNKPVDVEVTVSAKEITNIELKNMSASQEIFYPLFKPTIQELSSQILKYQSTKIASSTDNSVTSRILLDAVDTALEQAVPGAQ